MTLAIRLFASDRRCLLLVIPLALLLCATNLGRRDLWAPDEPRTGEIVREILATGSWTVLHDNGEPYLEKPPLYFWLAAAASRLGGGVNELTVRLPASLAAVAGAVALFFLGRGLFGRRCGALAAVVLLTTQKFFMEARWAHPDMLWSTCLILAALSFYQAWRPDGDRRFFGVFYLALGLAALTKGPLGLALPLLAVLTFLLVARDLASLRRCGLGWGLPLALLPSALWLVAYRVSAGEAFPLGAAFGRMAERFTQGVHHPRPFLHMPASLAVEALPWIVLLPAAVVHTFPRRRDRADRENAYVYSWIAVLVAVFAVSAEKRGLYLLPLLPFLSLLVGRLWDTALFRWEPSPVDRGIGWSLLAGLALAGAGAVLLLPRIGRELPGVRSAALLLAAAVLLTVLAALVAHRLLGGGTALAIFSAGLVVCYLVIAVRVLPALDRYKSARPFCARIVAAAGDAPLGIFPDYRAAYAFYTRRRLRVLRSSEDLRAFLRPGGRAYCLIEEDRFESERAALGDGARVVDREQVGHRAMLLVSAPAAP